jgi:hypothetical protein
VLDHGLVGELDQGLREGQGEGAKTGAETTDEDEGYKENESVYICFLTV